MIRFQEPQQFTFDLDGGYDLVSAHHRKKPGALIAGSNTEMVAGKQGYSRPGGFERCCDDVLPSETQVAFFELDGPAGGAIAADDLFTTGDLSFRALDNIAAPEVGDILAVATHDTGFAADDVCTCTATGVSFTIAAVIADTSDYTSDELRAYLRQAIEQTRDAVPEITGSGTPNGGFRLRGKNYVVRDGKLLRGDSTGWTEIAMPHVMYFDKGVSEFAVGTTVTDGTRTAVIRSVTLQSGAWNAALPDADKAAGYLTLTGATGTFPVAATLTVGGVTKAAVKTSNAAYVFPSGGDYQTKTYNFTNVADADSVYGVSGVGEAFEFDGTDYIPIFVPDAGAAFPFLVYIHQERLYLGYPGGQFVISVSGSPRVSNALLGSVTYSAGSELVGYRKIHGNCLAVFTKASVWLLLGTGILDETTQIRDWQFIEHDSSIGAIAGSIAEMGPPIFISGEEYRVVTPTDDSAGYRTNTILEDIRPLLKDNVEAIIGALWCRTKSQYRLFMSTGAAIYSTFKNSKPKGSIPQLFPIPVLHVWSAIENNVERIWFLSNTGYLYRMDSGNTFDDDYITGSFRVPFFAYGNPRRDKSFPQLEIEFDAPVLLTGDTEITYTVDCGYGHTTYPLGAIETLTEIEGAGGFYGSNSRYGSFVYGGPVVSKILAYVDGFGPNMSILVNFRTRYDNPFTFLAATVDYIQLGLTGAE